MNRLTQSWQEDQSAFAKRSLADVDYLHVWVDYVRFIIRLDEDRLCGLVMMGVLADGTKELVAIADGYRESKGSRADLLQNCKPRHASSGVSVGAEGARLWAAMRDVFPETKEQCVYVVASLLNAVPKSAPLAARLALVEIRDADDRAYAEAAIEASAEEFGSKWPKAVAKITEKPERLLAFLDSPAERWIHLMTTTAIGRPPRWCDRVHASRRDPVRGRRD